MRLPWPGWALPLSTATAFHHACILSHLTKWRQRSTTNPAACSFQGLHAACRNLHRPGRAGCNLPRSHTLARPCRSAWCATSTAQSWAVTRAPGHAPLSSPRSSASSVRRTAAAAGPPGAARIGGLTRRSPTSRSAGGAAGRTKPLMRACRCNNDCLPACTRRARMRMRMRTRLARQRLPTSSCFAWVADCVVLQQCEAAHPGQVPRC